MAAIKTARQIVDDAYAALLQRGDLEGFLTEFNDSSELREPQSLPYGGSFRGKDAIRSALKRVVVDYWTDLSYVIEAVVGGDEYVITYGNFSATGKKSGKKVSFPLAEVWKVQYGSVVLVQPIYGDTKLAAEALV
jgi:uncharacterized protein